MKFKVSAVFRCGTTFTMPGYVEAADKHAAIAPVYDRIVADGVMPIDRVRLWVVSTDNVETPIETVRAEDFMRLH